MSQRKKIAIVYDAIFPYVTGGAEKRFFETGRRLAQDGYDVHIYGMKCWDGPDIIESNGMTLHSIMKKMPLYTRKGKRSISEALRFGIAALKLHKESFDVVDCCGFPYFSLFSLRIVTWIKRKPLYSTWHEVWGLDYWLHYLGILGFLGYAVEKLASRLPDKIISVSDCTTEEIDKKLGRRKGVITVPNGIDLDKIRCIEKDEEEHCDVLFAGRLLQYKNVDRLIEAIALARERMPEISLTIVGEGPEGERLRSLASEKGLGQTVRFAGFTEENKLFSYMKSSKLLALPSSREGFGMVVLEANACGLPVLTVDEPHNAAKYLIRHGENGLITQASPESIAEGILEMLKKVDDMRPSDGIESYNWKDITARIEDIYALRSKF